MSKSFCIKIGDIQEIRTKNDVLLNKLEVIIFDETHAAFKLTLFVKFKL